MKLVRFIRHNSLVAVAAVLLTACGTQAEESAEPTSTPSPAGSTESTAAPSVEPTGQPEKPQQPGGGEPSIPVPTLPIGGTPDDSQVDQCVIANWLGDSDVPKNVSILVKTIEIKPPGVFDKTGSGCAGTTSCSGFAFTSSRTKCSVAVRAKAEHGQTARLLFTGTLRCPAGQDRMCRDFVKKIKPQSIQLRQPGEPPSPDDSPPSSNR